MSDGDRATKLAAAFAAEIPRIPWFASCGKKLGADEIFAARTYVAALDLGEFSVEGVKNWRTARDLTQHPDWSREWWEVESVAERSLHRRGLMLYEAIGPNGFLSALANVTEAAASIYAAALAVLARDGLSDEGLAKVASGAASQACHQAALARLVKTDDAHLFTYKFRLFAAGRWPLGIVGGTCFVF